MDTFGEWLRYQREQQHFNREQFAGRVGCSVAMLRKIENGERRPSEQIAGLMANCLGIPTEERSTFVKVARGELGVARLSMLLKPDTPAKLGRANLPVMPTPLIGRGIDVEQLSRLLRDPQCRLLTLVGPGGIGKTRLALEAAMQVQGAFADGVYFVPLAPVSSTRFIVPVIAEAIGYSFQSVNQSGYQSVNQAEPKIQLISYLQEKQALLLMDNLEQFVAQPGIEVIAELLAGAAQVKILSTTRTSLGLLSEWVYEVQGLPVPESIPDESSVQDTSIELFLQRARKADVRFNATLEDYPAIVRICRLVEGMPLGIELAAAWVRALTCVEIAKEIERGLDFLSVSAMDIPPRHRSMRAVFDHSWVLLTDEEQNALLRLSVFRGGFRREAVEAVAGVSLTVLSALLTNSLVRRNAAGRYDLHELIQQFSAQRLAGSPDVNSEVRARHGEYYLAFFSQADLRLRSSAQREALAELSIEMDNFNAAWDWAIRRSEFALMERTLRVLTLFFDMRGWLQDGLDLLGSGLVALEAAQGQSTPDRTRQVALGHFLTARALLASRLGQYEPARTMLERGIEVLRPLDERRVLVETITFLGVVVELTGDYTRALELYSEGFEMASAVGDQWFIALCLTCLVSLAGITQNLVTPDTTYERLLSVVTAWRSIGDPRFTAIGLNMLSWTALSLGRNDEARLALEESVALSKAVGDRYGLGFAYRGLGIIAQAQSDHVQAVTYFHQSLDTLSELGARQDVARVLAEMGRSLFALGDDAGASGVWHEAFRIAILTQGTFIMLEALLGMANLQAKQGKDEPALEIVLVVLSHPASFQDTRGRAALLRTQLEARLSEAEIESASAKANARKLEDLVGEARNQAASNLEA